jgi:hypothetical protein
MVLAPSQWWGADAAAIAEMVDMIACSQEDDAGDVGGEAAAMDYLRLTAEQYSHAPEMYKKFVELAEAHSKNHRALRKTYANTPHLLPNLLVHLVQGLFGQVRNLSRDEPVPLRSGMSTGRSWRNPIQPSFGDPVLVHLEAVTVEQGHAAPKLKRKFEDVESSESIRFRAAPGRVSHEQPRTGSNQYIQPSAVYADAVRDLSCEYIPAMGASPKIALSESLVSGVEERIRRAQSQGDGEASQQGIDRLDQVSVAVIPAQNEADRALVSYFRSVIPPAKCTLWAFNSCDDGVAHRASSLPTAQSRRPST